MKTATRAPEWPPEGVPEIAFVGRSNVGKSSMLNALARRTKLARVSNTPGRTRQLQFFELSYRVSPAARPERVRFCDLPGYGFARVPREEQERWAAMIEEYLTRRKSLRTVVLIVDARHPPAESDGEALSFLKGAGRPVVLAVTKADKLAKSQRAAAARRAERELQLPRDAAVLFSAVDRTGTDALWARIAAVVKGDATADRGDLGSGSLGPQV